VLYLANTVGAVLGSLATGYVLLPVLSMQGAAGVLAGVAAAAIVPLYLSHRTTERPAAPIVVGAGTVPIVAVAVWVMLPSDFLLQRALRQGDAAERVLTVREGPSELVAVVEAAGRGRGLMTNGHAMSSTARLDQRYMRALAHVPLLLMDDPARALVIGFGVGNTTHAVTLHESVTRVEVADLSRNILQHASYFEDANRGVIGNPKVSVFINDGRMHLQMMPPFTYDLITLEPPPIAYAGVAALYSREFYELARTRLRDGGYVSQWLPAYQVPGEVSLAMVKAFVDVFPQSVLLSGAQAELILLGTTGPRVQLDPERVAEKIEANPSLREDLVSIELATPREVAAAFVGSADTMRRATQDAEPLVDDRPVQEYGVLSSLTTGLLGVPAALFELSAAPGWCPGCYADGSIAPVVAGLDLQFALLQQAYVAPVTDLVSAVGASFGARRILGSAYLGAVVPDSAEVHNILGVAALREDRVDEAVVEFQAALSRDPQSANARANLAQIRSDQGGALLQQRRYLDAVPLLRAAVHLDPGDAETQNDLGVALASLGRIREAVEHFTRAAQLAPDFIEARENLAAAQQALRR
jgi:spermidine synthase